MRHTLSALGICLPTLTGCLVSEPPEYDPRPRSPILLDLVNALPSITEPIIVLRPDATSQVEPVIRFNIPLRSEDDGEEVWFALHSEYGLPQSALAYPGRDISPSNFEEQRYIAFDWKPQTSPARALTPGCHQLTLLVAHESGWSKEERAPTINAPLGETAMAVWWLNMYPEPSQASTLAGCPTRSGLEM